MSAGISCSVLDVRRSNSLLKVAMWGKWINCIHFSMKTLPESHLLLHTVSSCLQTPIWLQSLTLRVYWMYWSWGQTSFFLNLKNLRCNLQHLKVVLDRPQSWWRDVLQLCAQLLMCLRWVPWRVLHPDGYLVPTPFWWPASVVYGVTEIKSLRPRACSVDNQQFW